MVPFSTVISSDSPVMMTCYSGEDWLLFTRHSPALTMWSSVGVNVRRPVGTETRSSSHRMTASLSQPSDRRRIDGMPHPLYPNLPFWRAVSRCDGQHGWHMQIRDSWSPNCIRQPGVADNLPLCGERVLRASAAQVHKGLQLQLCANARGLQMVQWNWLGPWNSLLTGVGGNTWCVHWKPQKTRHLHIVTLTCSTLSR